MTKFFALWLLLFASLSFGFAQESESLETRNYCTEIGRFDLLFYGEQVSGYYVLLPKKISGAIWGKLEGSVVTGRWIDEDGAGDIILTFNEDYSWFTTDYRGDDEPDKWYRDQWHGALRPHEHSIFELDGKRYQCE